MAQPTTGQLGYGRFPPIADIHRCDKLSEVNPFEPFFEWLKHIAPNWVGWGFVTLLILVLLVTILTA